MTKRSSKTSAGDRPANEGAPGNAEEAPPPDDQPSPEDTVHDGTHEPTPAALEQAPDAALQPDHQHDAQLAGGAQHIGDVPQVPVSTPEIPPPAQGYTDGGPNPDFDPDGAQRLLEQLPQKSDEEVARDRAQFEMGQLDRAGLDSAEVRRTADAALLREGPPAYDPRTEKQTGQPETPAELQFDRREDAVHYVVRYGGLGSVAEVEALSDTDLMSLARELYAARVRAGDVPNLKPGPLGTLGSDHLDVPENLKGNALIAPVVSAPAPGPHPLEDPNPPMWFKVTKGGRFMGESMMVEIKEGAFINERTHNLQKLYQAGVRFEATEAPPAYSSL